MKTFDWPLISRRWSIFVRSNWRFVISTRKRSSGLPDFGGSLKSKIWFGCLLVDSQTSRSSKSSVQFILPRAVRTGSTAWNSNKSIWSPIDKLFKRRVNSKKPFDLSLNCWAQRSSNKARARFRRCALNSKLAGRAEL